MRILCGVTSKSMFVSFRFSLQRHCSEMTNVTKKECFCFVHIFITPIHKIHKTHKIHKIHKIMFHSYSNIGTNERKHNHSVPSPSHGHIKLPLSHYSSQSNDFLSPDVNISNTANHSIYDPVVSRYEVAPDGFNPPQTKNSSEFDIQRFSCSTDASSLSSAIRAKSAVISVSSNGIIKTKRSRYSTNSASLQRAKRFRSKQSE